MKPEEQEKRAFQIFWILNIVRFMAVGVVMLGIAIANGKLLAPGNEWIGYIIVAIGFIEFFFMPNVIRKAYADKDKKQL